MEIKKLKIGITGGIGSGKSTICRMFQAFGVPVYFSDLRAKKLINSNIQIIEYYKSLFGDDIYNNGVLNTKEVGQKLFCNPNLVKEVQEFIHPIVRKDFSDWVSLQHSNIVINEAAVLFEGGGNLFMDEVITVIAPIDLRISRVVKRDGLSNEEILNRIKNQWCDEKKAALSSYVIVADDKQMVIPQVLNIYNDIVTKTKFAV
jgi:dephospho-CoA kinase